MTDLNASLLAHVAQRNADKLLFTAGPASLLPENLSGLRPCFGRGDRDYETVEHAVLEQLKAMSGHQQIARLQGSASLALEIMTLNFLYGRILVVDTGYYSDRMHQLARTAAKQNSAITALDYVPHQSLENHVGHYDWLIACPTETSCGLRLPVAELATQAKRLGALLMLDATASIGLETGHELAEVIAYSSCKGLFGLTGASFIAFNAAAQFAPDSFYLNLQTHLEKRITGPYHAIASLADVLPRHSDHREAVVINKTRFLHEMKDWLTLPPEQQPLLCTHVRGHIQARDPRAVLYTPRSKLGGSVVCHLGEAHLGRSAAGDILQALSISEA